MNEKLDKKLFTELSEKLKIEKLPRHIAIIMDGNGRWAGKKLLKRIDGHRKGIEAVRDTITFSRELGIKYLTLYTFSRENWSRPEAEVNMLMRFLQSHLKSEAELMMKNNICFTAIGNRDDLPEGVRKAIEGLEETTRGNDGMFLQLAISYGSRDEIVEACRTIAAKVSRGELELNEINEKTITGSLYTKDLPDPDLLIRTSGEKRISNFLLWQIAYTELYISDVLWPDFSRNDLLEAIVDFQSRERRFGLTQEQLTDDQVGEQDSTTTVTV